MKVELEKVGQDGDFKAGIFSKLILSPLNL
jgi:hypothetical protein